MSQNAIARDAAASTIRTIASAGTWLARAARKLWLGLREWCGDSAYERYLQARPVGHPKSATLTREEFYVEQLNRRYSRPSRCC